jgi:hypothetical protein
MAPLMQESPALFLDTNEVAAPPIAPQVVRQRFVKVDLDLLLDSKKQARRIKEITINLFPDVVYTGVIERIEFDGAGYSWSGHLRSRPPGRMTMVYTAGVFIGHFAAPDGIYEVSVVGESDLYRAVLIDQQKLPQQD